MHTAWDLLAFPRLCGLIAKKPTRLSLEMHNAGFRELGLPFFYVAFDTEDTAQALSAMRSLGFRGLSLSIPHKEKAIAFLDSLDERAQQIGAVNTVINDGNKLSGFNTDWIGIREALKESKIDLLGKNILLYGAGGAARAAILALKELSVGQVILCNRTPERAEKLAKEFGLPSIKENEISSTLANEFHLLVNSTPIGSKLDSSESPLLSFFKTPNSLNPPAVFEMVTRETPLEKAARAAGVTVVSGSRMLLYQALEQFRLFTTQEAPREVLDSALRSALLHRGSNS